MSMPALVLIHNLCFAAFWVISFENSKKAKLLPIFYDKKATTFNIMLLQSHRGQLGMLQLSETKQNSTSTTLALISIWPAVLKIEMCYSADL